MARLFLSPFGLGVLVMASLLGLESSFSVALSKPIPPAPIPSAPIPSAPILSAQKARPVPPPKRPLIIPHSQRPNVTRAGGSLGDSCRAATKTLLALVPPSNPVTTTNPHPSMWVYVPYGAEDVQGAEFSVNAGLDEKQRLYRSSIALSQKPGFVRLSLPTQSQYALQPGMPYRWYFTVHCDRTNSASVEAGIELVATGSASASSSLGNAWYDTLATTAQQFQGNPQDPQASDRWRQLLRSLNLEGLAGEPFVSSQVIP
jgi:hypothetical protein